MIGVLVHNRRFMFNVKPRSIHVITMTVIVIIVIGIVIVRAIVIVIITLMGPLRK